MRILLIFKICKQSTGKELKLITLPKRITGMLIKVGIFSFVVGKSEKSKE